MSRRAALVTGASRGIGRAVLLTLAARGYAVAGCWRSESEEAEKTRAAATALDVPTLLDTCDVTDHAAVEEFVARAETDLGPLDGAVSNAGVTRDASAVGMDPADWQAVIDTNLTGTWNVCRSVAFRFMKRHSGSIVAMSSVAGVVGNSGQTNYAASKAGIVGLVKSLAREVGGFGVRVNAVAPGFIETDMTAALGDRQRRKAVELVMLRRFGSAAEVAEATAFLLDDASAYVTGSVLHVDGGIRL